MYKENGQTNSAKVKIISLKEIKKEQTDIVEDEQLSTKATHSLLQAKIDQAKYQLTSLTQQKDQLLHELKQSIETEKIAWQEQKLLEKEQAKEEGYSQGFDEGKKEALATYEQLISEANNLVHLATKDYERTVEKHEQAILQLSITVAEKIMLIKLAENPDNFLSLVTAAIRDLKDKSNIRIYVHPAQYEHVIKQKAELEQLIEEDELISIYIDANLTEGDCILKHPFGQLDIGIDSQLQQLKVALEQFVQETTK